MKVEVYTQPLMIEIGGRLSFINVTITAGPDPMGLVLCLHDLMGKGTEFQSLAGILAAQGWKVVAPDFPGRGRSVRVPPQFYTLHTGVDVAAALLQTHQMPRTVVVGAGWGAMLALALENVWKPAPSRLVLCDLPLVWSFGADARAQLWAQLGTLMAPTDAAFLERAAEIAAPHGAVGAEVLAAIAPRLDGPEGARSLCVDPGIFDILRRTANKGSIAGPMLRVSSAEIILIYGRAMAAQGPEARNARFAPKQPPTLAYAACDTFVDWANPSAALPVLGAVLA